MSYEHQAAPPLSLQRYRSLLESSLTSPLVELVPFFCNLKRLEMLQTLLKRHVTEAPRRVLNVGSGPFATECFSTSLAASEFTSLDYTSGFDAVYQALRDSGHLTNTDFFVASATEVDFEPAYFDLILMHDLLYEPALDAPALINHYHRFLKPGGYFFFDVMDCRIGPLWRALGREKSHRRYALPALRNDISHNFEVLEVRPYLGLWGPVDVMLRRLLWHTVGLANNFAFLIRSR